MRVAAHLVELVDAAGALQQLRPAGEKKNMDLQEEVERLRLS